VRNLSTTALTALTAEETGEVFLMLLTITHQDLDEPIRVVNDLVDHTSRGNAYIAYPFQVTLPIDDGTSFPSLGLQIDNVDLTLIKVIRTLVSAPSVLIEFVLASVQDVVEMSLPDMTMREIKYDAHSILASVTVEDQLNQRFPNREYSPSSWQGLF